MKNKKHHVSSQSITKNSEPPFPDNPVLSSYFLSISQFLDKICQEDQSLSFNDKLNEIFDEAVKIVRQESNSTAISDLDINWRSLSNQILFQVQHINQRNQSSKILQCTAAIKDIITYTNEASPIAQAAKKEHHNVYVIIKKAILHIEQSVTQNDFDRASLLLHNFKNDLPKTYTKFFQLSQLDRAASISAIQDCKKNTDQILRILTGTNQLYAPPVEFQSFTRFINQLKLKSDVKKPIVSTQRSKTPPARIPKPSYQKNTFANTITLSPPSLETSFPGSFPATRKSLDSTLSPRKLRSPNNQTKEPATSSHYKTLLIPNDKLSRSRTPPSKIPSIRSSRLSPSNIPTRRNQNTDSSKSNENNLHPNQKQRLSKTQLVRSSPTSTKVRKSNLHQQNLSLVPSDTHETDIENDPKHTSKKKNESSSLASPQNEPQKKKQRNINSNNNNNNTPIKKNSPFSPISFSPQPPDSSPSKKSMNRSQNLNKKKDQCCNLISTAVTLDRSVLNGSSSSENLTGSNTTPNSHSSLSQDSETDQLVMAVKKAKEQVSELSPTLEKLQRDLSGGLFYRDDSTSQLSPSSPPTPSPLPQKGSSPAPQQLPPPQPQLQLGGASKRKVKSSGQKSIQKKEEKNDAENEVEINIDDSLFSPRGLKGGNEVKSKTVRSFDSRQTASVSKYSHTTIEAAYSDFLTKLDQFDQLISIGVSLKKFNDQIKRDDKDSVVNYESDLSSIDEAIAAYHCGRSAMHANELSMQIGRSLSILNRKIESSKDEVTFVGEIEQIERMIESAISSNSSAKQQQTSQLFLQTVKANKPLFESAKVTLLNKQKKNQAKLKGKNKKKKVDDFENDEYNEAELKIMLEEEIERLTVELSNLKAKEKFNDDSKLINQNNNEDLTDPALDDKLNAMSRDELNNFLNELSLQLSEIQDQHEIQLMQIIKDKEESMEKRNQSKSELENTSKQIYEIHKALLKCGRNKTTEFQSKVVQKEDLQTDLMNLIEKENQIIQKIISDL